MTLANLKRDELEPEQAEGAKQEVVVAPEQSKQVLASARAALTLDAQVLEFQSEYLIQVCSKLKLVREEARLTAVPVASARRVAWVKVAVLEQSKQVQVVLASAQEARQKFPKPLLLFQASPENHIRISDI